MRARGFIALAIGVVALALIVRSCGRKAPVIEDGVVYQFLNFSKIDTVKNADGETVPAYLITFVYTDGEKETRGTIAVPRDVLREDRKLLAGNRMIWDYPVTIEGRTYQTVRWNPLHKIPATEVPSLKEEEQPVRK